jgi:hypothetical protein
MKLKILPPFLFSLALIFCDASFAQLNINSATFFIQPGATVAVQGNVTSNVDIQGTGTLLLNGTVSQILNMNGFAVPILEVNNGLNVKLIGSIKINNGLVFTNGKIILDTNNLTLSNIASASGQGSGKFAETNGTGQVFKSIIADVTNYEMPIGSGASYLPAYLSSVGSYSNALIGVRAISAPDANRPPMISDYLLVHWPVTRAGITGTVTVKGQYTNADIRGTESNLIGYYFNGANWDANGESHDAALNTVTASIQAASGDVYGMDKFVLSKAKVFLQAAYNTSTGVMSDNLRQPTNLIPLSDPYRTAPYNASFIPVADPVVETARAAVFANQPSTDSNIVDWVFIELRDNQASPGNVVLQTRSALLQRNGNIVDVDGKSPVTFNNIVDGSYTIAVRHRNHLGISADPSNNLILLRDNIITATTLDLTTASDAQIYGPSSAYAIASNGRNMMWGGNANVNTNIRYNGAANDKDYILLNELGNNVGLVLPDIYSVADLNMNRNVRYNGAANDKDFILLNVLNSNVAGIKIQALPN